MEIDRVYCGDCVETTESFPDNSVKLVVTSPPYDGLRLYNGFRFNLEGIARQLYRVIEPGGVVVWVVGDETINGSESGTSFRQALHFMELGFNLHDTMIYKKHNFANPSSNRYHQIFEYMFVFSKGKPKTFNPIKDKVNKCAGQSNWGKNTARQKDGSVKERPKRVYNALGMRVNIWEYNTGGGFSQSNKIAHKHPATFPEKLARDHILTWSNPGDLVLDPMCGSGTTLREAKKLGRHYIGIDISPEYVDLANKLLYTK